MFNRYSSLKLAQTLKSAKLQSKTSTAFPSQIPKSFITATLEDSSPSRRAASLLKQETFGQQLFKKHQEKAKKFVLEFIHMVAHGSKMAYKDAKYLAAVVSSKPKKSYTVEEISEVKRITRDLTKFVPFYASLIIPAGEIALIPYLWLFPRAVPSYFMSETAIKEEKYKYLDKQTQAHESLREHVLSVMAKHGYDVNNKDLESMKTFFMENRDKLMPELDLTKMNSCAIKNASDFLMFEYVEGTYILNKLYKTFVNMPMYAVNFAMWASRSQYRAAWSHPILDYNFKLNSFLFEGAKKQFLLRQFKKQLGVMKAQNYAMLSSFFGNLSEEGMLGVARTRGYNSDKEEEAKKWIKDQWNTMSEMHLNNDMYLFWYSVVAYESH